MPEGGGKEVGSSSAGMNRIKFVGFARPAEFLRHRLASQRLRAPRSSGQY